MSTQVNSIIRLISESKKIKITGFSNSLENTNRKQTRIVDLYATTTQIAEYVKLLQTTSFPICTDLQTLS